MEQDVDSDEPRGVAASAYDVGETTGSARLRYRIAVGAVLVFVVLFVAYLGLLVRNLAGLRVHLREHSAYVRLKDISSAQVMFWERRPKGSVEAQPTRYGFLSELVDLVADKRLLHHNEHCPCSSCVLGLEFAQVERGRIHDDGYIYEIYLPAKDGGWATEVDVANGRELDLQRSQKQFLCYAWPESVGQKGRRVFAIDAVGDVRSSRENLGCYEGDRAPIPGRTGCLGLAAHPMLAHQTEDVFGDFWVSW